RERPSGWKPTQRTQKSPTLTRRSATSQPVATSYSRTSPPPQPVASVLPSGLKATHHDTPDRVSRVTDELGRPPASVCRSRPVATSPTWTTPAHVVPATRLPSGENATARTWDFGAGRVRSFCPVVAS